MDLGPIGERKLIISGLITSVVCIYVESNIEKLQELSEILAIDPFDEQAAVVCGDVRSALERKGI